MSAGKAPLGGRRRGDLSRIRSELNRAAHLGGSQGPSWSDHSAACFSRWREPGGAAVTAATQMRRLFVHFAALHLLAAFVVLPLGATWTTTAHWLARDIAYRTLIPETNDH